MNPDRHSLSIWAGQINVGGVSLWHQWVVLTTGYTGDSVNITEELGSKQSLKALDRWRKSKGHFWKQ